uniref:DH domain-containing protein n=1 Tax=Brugia timori TaxID=42155 RepID=A0A0R3R5S7_9BILA
LLVSLDVPLSDLRVYHKEILLLRKLVPLQFVQKCTLITVSLRLDISQSLLAAKERDLLPNCRIQF